VLTQLGRRSILDRFSLAPIEEVHLQRAPLAKVLMQVQYSRTPQLITESAENFLAEALGRYPVRRRQITAMTSVLVNGQPLSMPHGAAPPSLLTFTQPNGDWQVTLSDTSVALETAAYMTRDDFCERALEVFRALASVTLPPVVDRVGLRYIDRLSGDALARLSSYVRPELRVLHDALEKGLALHHSVTDSLIEVSDLDRLQVRTGLLPAGAGFDPALAPLSEESWVLDMDVFTQTAGFPFEPEDLANRLRSYAEIAYSFFRYATTDVFEADHIGEQSLSAKDFR
jgi:uncharacterized protein (TIGR04255 family)